MNTEQTVRELANMIAEANRKAGWRDPAITGEPGEPINPGNSALLAALSSDVAEVAQRAEAARRVKTDTLGDADSASETLLRENAIAAKLVLIVTEVQEALEALEEGGPVVTYEATENGDKPCGLGSEIADIIVRAIGLAVQIDGLDIVAVLLEKIAYNQARSYRHGGLKA